MFLARVIFGSICLLLATSVASQARRPREYLTCAIWGAAGLLLVLVALIEK